MIGTRSSTRNGISSIYTTGGRGRPAIARPADFDQMLAIASQLPTGFDFGRVDLYNVDGRIHFGEPTLTPMAGYLKLRPESRDLKLGEKWNVWSRA